MLELIFGMDYNNQFSNTFSLLSFFDTFPVMFSAGWGTFQIRARVEM